MKGLAIIVLREKTATKNNASNSLCKTSPLLNESYAKTAREETRRQLHENV